MDLLLESLCRICNVHEAKYTCPRCSLQTCSLPCARRHKIRASCNGIRDPTLYKPRSILATPQSIDHDYNFLHSIEHRVERSEKLIVEERGLVDSEELKIARTGEEDRDMKRKKMGAQERGEIPIQKCLEKMGTTIQRAPKGMRRNLENETSWSKKLRAIYWQVEWIREDSSRVLSKAIAKQPIGEAYAEILEQERKKQMTVSERKAELKRKAETAEGRKVKRTKMDLRIATDTMANPVLQDPETGTWSLTPTVAQHAKLNQHDSQALPKPTLPVSYSLYLLRPYTPSSLPKVLVPLDTFQPLEVILKGRTVLEFPTVFVLENVENNLPQQFMLEKDFISKAGKEPDNPFLSIKDDEQDDQESSEAASDSDTSSSGSDEGSEMDIDELVPTVWS